MKAVVQRVSKAAVSVDGTVRGSIGKGLLVFLGIHKDDTEKDTEWMTRKIAGLRIFEDATGRMNRNVTEDGGGLLVISQFTLIASNRKGNRPSFNDAAAPQMGAEYYEEVCEALSNALGKPVARGVFGADMKVELLNDGPVTIVLDSKE